MPGGTDHLLVRTLRGSGTLCGVLSWVVFGTLLGPEATGPCGGSPFVGVAGWVLFVSGFPAATSRTLVCVWGVWCGVVV